MPNFRPVHSLSASAFFFVANFAHAQQTQTKADPTPLTLPQTAPQDGSRLWFTGSVAEAFHAAKAQKRPILLFWTAVWCPYCNEIKSAVFSRREFQDLMAQAIPVLLDGDSEDAAAYGEKFDLSGFPTIVFFNSQGEELTRFTENMTMDEFQSTFASVVAANAPISQLLSRVRAGKASANDWRSLARFPWRNVERKAENDPENSLLAVLAMLSQRCPANLTEERALFSAELLATAAGTNPKENQLSAVERKILANTKKRWRAYFAQLTQNQKSTFAARSFFLGESVDFVNWLHPSLSSRREKALIVELRGALATLRKDANLPVYHRLESWNIELDLDKPLGNSDNKKESNINPSVAPERAKQIVDAAEAAVKEATSPLVRQPTITIAAGLLWDVDRKDRARALLETEIAHSETPYYYHSNLARMAEEQGDFAKALQWSDAAAQSAQGKMTKPRWMVKDIGLRLKLKEKVPAEAFEPDFTKRLDSYFLFTMADKSAFVGSALRRTQSLAKKLEDWSRADAHKEQIKSWQRRCADQSEPSRKNCSELFDKLLNPPEQRKNP